MLEYCSLPNTGTYRFHKSVVLLQDTNKVPFSFRDVSFQPGELDMFEKLFRKYILSKQFFPLFFSLQLDALTLHILALVFIISMLLSLQFLWY